MRLEKVKRPGGVFWYDVQHVRTDRDGNWLYGPVGTPWGAPHDHGTLEVAIVVLIPLGQPWVAWWVEDPADPRLELDVCQMPERTDQGWRYVDLELDPVRHELDLRVEIEDQDELETSVSAGWVSPEDAAVARRTADELAGGLRAQDRAWHDAGWQLLAQLGRTT